MRVAIIHHQYKRGGGMETYLFDLVQGFLEQQDSLEVFAGKIDPGCVAPGLRRLHRIPCWPFLPRRLRPLVFARKLPRVLPLQAFDLVLSLTRTAHQDVLICGGTHRGYLQALGRRPGLCDRLEIALETRGYRHATHIVVHSRKLAEEVVTLYGVASTKVRLLYPPIDTTRFTWTADPVRRRCRQQLGLDSRRTTLLFPGAGNPRKGYFELLKAFALLPQDRFELLTAGKHPAGRRGNIRHLGYVRDLRPLYAAVDFTILPSRYEPFGLAVAESLQCGTPVIISSQVAAGELLTPEEGMVLPSLEPSRMAEAIQRAARTRFIVAPDFVQRNGLTIDRHVRELRELNRGGEEMGQLVAKENSAFRETAPAA